MLIYKDKSKPIEERVKHLIGLMTLEEKVGQLVQPFGWQVYEHIDGELSLHHDFKQQVQNGGVGSLYGVLRADPWTGVTLENGLSAKQGAEAVNMIQRYAIEHSRLGIPILIGEECSHGHMAIDGTVFPVPLSIGSTWNVDLYRDMCRAVASETRAQGGAVTYSPVLDVVRDPRWGRTEECFGEDPYLIGEFAVAAVEGLQGESLFSEHSVAATLKHFAGYGSSEGGRNAGPVHMGWRELLEIDLYPFQKAVEAGAQSVMPAYNEIDGVPCTVNTELLDDILRQAWGFDGLIITDCGAIEMLASGHDVAENGLDAAVQAIRAGIDMEMSGEMFGSHLVEAVHAGKLETSVLDRAVRRVLTLKFRLGLFDKPYVNAERAEQVIGQVEHIRLARQLATEGIVLLKNVNSTLPLPKTFKRIAVIGPNADQIYNQLGDYTSPQQRSRVVTVLDGIRSKLSKHQDGVLYAPGCRIKGESREGFDNALACAAEADTVVMVVGGSSARDFGEGTIDLKTGASKVSDHDWNDMECGEGIDRMTLGLAGVQLQLMQEVYRLGKELVVVYMNGRPIAEPWVEEHAHAIVEAWYPGQEGGHAIADILFGDVNPSGRLTLSIPKHVGQLPVYYNGKRSRGKRYLEDDAEPRYPFGYGLSYTTFSYERLTLSANSIRAGESVTVTVDVTNTGDREGAEVVQLYISDVVSSVTRPIRELKGFCKLVLQPGETRTVVFVVGSDKLQYIGHDLQPVVEAGRFSIQVGRHSKDTLCAELIVREDE
ncbi:glycoside hydrolase family 3 N-terminal domain-containing protein [Paenibacillus polymyxa]|uniref:glycoside hydrolase family 3 N-terminal domain-containing protein n=1 Tax=Paenibacillus TaxID=44249 RepID=UPI000F4F6748|nr:MULTISPECIES: glycoside hydrolase family 3 N-terminal domain-containing protein [Paenibacillus]KAF6659379.1 glycoside hydrolase family 3 C-terminal domain-containing protein [Paenibacillus sp. EKM301P]RPE01883.1 beta-glucosidase [Paenibacillus polymyxa]UBS85928.1 glycoside hydrolase family 3 C-terminal domain-containing protein [Paenibacillus polymyxa]WHX34453.1 glycoside hydrolase family 3 N-terminal domain-containing protein [Paenibacillus polymyxa]